MTLSSDEAESALPLLALLLPLLALLPLLWSLPVNWRALKSRLRVELQ